VQKASASVSNEVHTAYRDKFIRLQHTKVSTVVVTNVAGTTTYVAGTDYVLYAAEGMIEILPAAITEALAMITDEHAEMAITGQLLLDKLRAQGDQYYSWKIEE